MKKTILLCLGLLTAVITTACFAEEGLMVNKEITIKNSSNKGVYIYNYSYGTHEKTTPINDGSPLASGDSVQLPLLPRDKMRIYFASEKLSKSIESDAGAPPDPFNYHSDATVMYSFVEYNGKPDPGHPDTYVINLSWIDEYSFPITLRFNKDVQGVKANTECGIKSLSGVKKALKDQTDYNWSALIWPMPPPDDNYAKTIWDTEAYKINIYRIIGPNKVWGQTNKEHTDKLDGNWVPSSYGEFVAEDGGLQTDGHQLFGGTDSSTTNWNVWQNNDVNKTPNPSKTGYVKALKEASINSGIMNGDCWPKDDDKEFTYVPNSVDCTVTIYPYDS